MRNLLFRLILHETRLCFAAASAHMRFWELIFARKLQLPLVTMHDDSKGLLAASSKLSWPPLNRGRIPSLDGLRAVSIMLVLIGHGSSTFPAVGGVFQWLL